MGGVANSRLGPVEEEECESGKAVHQFDVFICSHGSNRQHLCSINSFFFSGSIESSLSLHHRRRIVQDPWGLDSMEDLADRTIPNDSLTDNQTLKPDFSSDLSETSWYLTMSIQSVRMDVAISLRVLYLHCTRTECSSQQLPAVGVKRSWAKVWRGASRGRWICNYGNGRAPWY